MSTMTLVLLILLMGLFVAMIAFVLAYSLYLLRGIEQRVDDLEDHADELAPPYRKSWDKGEKKVS